jgi:hypothetical protein
MLLMKSSTLPVITLLFYPEKQIALGQNLDRDNRFQSLSVKGYRIIGDQGLLALPNL